MRGEILGVERRCFWREEAKLKIVMSVWIGGASVTQLAQRHKVTRQQIYAWRQDFKKKGLWSADSGVLFIPLEMPVAVTQPILGSDLLHADDTPIRDRIAQCATRGLEKGSDSRTKPRRKTQTLAGR
jgi:transposase